MRACGHSANTDEAVPLDVLVQSVRELHTRWDAPLVVTRVNVVAWCVTARGFSRFLVFS